MHEERDMNSLATLRHLAFFDELSRLSEEDDAWKEISAGLVVLRVIDRWLEEGASVVAADAWGYTSVIDAVDAIPVGRPVRGMLRSVLDAMAATTMPNFRTVAPRLMAYARALDFDARWPLAVDVYHTVIAFSEPLENADTVIAAHLRLGYCLRQIGEIDQSAAAYGMAGRIAEQTGDMVGVLRARIGDAKIAILRGNLPRAEIILDETIENAGKHGLPDVESLALQDRAGVAGLRGNYELAVRLAYRALPGSESERNRDRLLHDIAVSFSRLGVRSAARDAFLVLVSTSADQYVRWSSSIQLLALAAADGVGPMFEKYRLELASQPLPAALRAEYEYETGRGYLALGHFEDATTWLTAAVSTANANGLYQTVFEAESELVQAKQARRVEERSAPFREVAPDVTEVAEAMRTLRETTRAGER
jgi:tetratricopeptide (TPR) repeat protein